MLQGFDQHVRNSLYVTYITHEIDPSWDDAWIKAQTRMSEDGSPTYPYELIEKVGRYQLEVLLVREQRPIYH